MGRSKYTLVKEQFPENDYCLLYNTLSKAVALLSTNDLQRIGTEKESLITDLKSLYEQGFLVDQDDDERSKINMYFTSLKCNYFSYATMIYTTYDCIIQYSCNSDDLFTKDCFAPYITSIDSENHRLNISWPCERSLNELVALLNTVNASIEKIDRVSGLTAAINSTTRRQEKE